MKSKTHLLNPVSLVLMFTFAIPLQAQAIDYYVNQNHPSANDQNAGTIDQPWKTISKANQALTPGDTAYINAGTYSSYIAPVNSGTSSARITYRNYATDTVTIANTGYGIHLNGKSYVTVQGINFSNVDQFLLLQNGANRNIIAYCNFDQGRTIGWSGSQIYRNSSYNWIHHSRFSKYGYFTNDDIGSILDIGTEASTTDNSNYNVIEDSTFYHGGHHVLGVFSNFNVLRNNFMHNENWYNYGGTRYGNRVLYVLGYRNYTMLNVIEGNRIGYAGIPSDGDSSYNLQLSASYNIVRYNEFYKGTATGIILSMTSNYPDSPSYNRIYNNTFWANGIAGVGGEKECGIGLADWEDTGNITGNVFKNNLFYQNGSPATSFAYYYVSPGNQIIANNWEETGDPQFTNISGTDPMSSTSPDFTLQSNSPVINVGRNLTTVSTIIDTDTIVVADAYYFQPGTWAAPEVGLMADEICIGTLSNCVKISSITYSTNRIDTASAHGAQVGDAVWLYKDSGGKLVLVGSGPDIGAHEYGIHDNQTPSAPGNLRVRSP